MMNRERSGTMGMAEDFDDFSPKIASYRAALRTFVAKRIKDPDATEDLVQEAYARLIARSKEGDVAFPQAYLFRIASNLLVDRHRRNNASGENTLPYEDGLVGTEPQQEELCLFHDLQAEFELALDELPPRCREIFVMYKFDDLSSAEIAAHFRITRRMVQKYLVKTHTHLYQRLGHLREPLS